jgi:hypothetical protein
MKLARLRGYVFSAVVAAPLIIAAPAGGLAATEGYEPPVGLLAQEATPPPPGTDAAPRETTQKPGPPPPPKNLELLDPGKSTGVLGKKVVGPDGKDLGLVVDVVVDADGRPQAAVIDFGGFLGVGSRKIAVSWRLLSFAPGRPDWQVLLVVTRSEIQAAPEYKPNAPIGEMVGPPWEAPPSPAAK